MGAINSDGLEFLGDLGRHITQVTVDIRESAFLFQSLSVLIQHYNAVAIQGTFAPTTSEDEFYRSFQPICFYLLFLLFNPRDLYYRGHKKKKNNNNNNNNRALLSSLSLSILFIYISHITQDIFIISIKVHNNASTDLLPQLSTNVTQSFGTIKACCLKPTISQHFCYLSILYKTNSTYSDTSPHF